MFFLSYQTYDLVGKKFQSAVSVDNGKQISDSYHLDKQGGTESCQDIFDTDVIGDSKDHGKADADDSYIAVADKTDHDGCKE